MSISFLDTRTIKWTVRMLSLAKLVSTWSKDTERQVGCVITDQFYHILSTGFNGMPPGVADNEQQHLKDHLSMHAEMNALMRIPNYVNSFKVFIYGGHPCSTCARLLYTRGAADVFCPAIEEGSKWTAGMEVARELFKEHNVYYVPITNIDELLQPHSPQ